MYINTRVTSAHTASILQSTSIMPTELVVCPTHKTYTRASDGKTLVSTSATTYRRNTKRKNVTREDINKVIDSISSGTDIKAAAIANGVAYTTFIRCLVNQVIQDREE